MFSTLDSTKTLNKSGTGIGLYQSNKFAQKLSPDNSQGISVDSELDKGSTFSFILENKEITVNEFDEQLPPIVIKSKTIKIFEQRQANQCCKTKILAVDDEPFNIIALRNMLKSFNETCDAAFDGKTALKMIKKQKDKSCKCRYKLILMDCNMPRMNGFETYRYIR